MTAGSGNFIDDPMFRGPSASDFNVLANGVGVHVGAGNRSRLKDIERKLPVVLARGDLVGRTADTVAMRLSSIRAIQSMVTMSSAIRGIIARR